MTEPAAQARDGGAVRRNVLILSASQALAMTGSSMVVTVSALAGQILAPSPALATLPFALQFVGTLLSTIPASLLMGKIGRRAGFAVGQAIGIVSAAIAAYAILNGMFVLFALACTLLGVHNAFWQYLRFAAAETADGPFRAKAISYVLAGGVVAAVAGPELAKHTKALFEPVLFAGSFVALACLCAATLVLVQFLKMPQMAQAGSHGGGRPLKEIVRQPRLIVAVLSAMIGYGVMVLVMTATPLAMVGCGFAFEDAAFVIQWHVLGMYVPSFFTGHLLARFGAYKIILAGTLLNIVCMAANLMDTGLLNFWVGLVTLGVGWNFMFVGGTALLTDCYRPEERSRVQALNDFLVFSTVAAASFLSGALQNAVGWSAVNLAMALPVLIAFGAVVALRLHERRTVTS